MNREHDRLGRTRSPVRAVWLMGLMLLWSGASAHAQTLYVSGYREIMLRTGPSVEHRIIAVLRTGNELEVIREENDYSLVSLPDGRQGYVLKSFLTNEAPPRRQIEELTARLEAQAMELDQLRGEHARLMAASDKLNTDYQSDKRLLQQFRQESTDLQRDMRLWWFLAGAGVLLTGWLMGWTRVRLRKKTRPRSFQ